MTSSNVERAAVVPTLVVGTTAPAKRSDPRRKKPNRIRGRFVPYLFLLPALVFELLVHIGPMLVGIFLSFLKLTQFQIAHWWTAPLTGVGNYSIVLDFSGATGLGLLKSFGVTLAYTAITIAASWALGIVGATALQKSFRGRTLLRGVFLIPYALPAYAAVIVWNFILQRDNGMLNHVLVDQLGLFSGDRPFWLIGTPAFWSMCVVAIWRTWPFAFLILMAGMQSVPSDLYEAASLDGASTWRQFRSITLPLLRPVNEILVLVMFLWTFNDFGTPFILFGGNPPASADLISIHVYQSSFATWNFGLGSAMSVVLMLFLLVVTSIYLAITRRRSNDA